MAEITLEGLQKSFEALQETNAKQAEVITAISKKLEKQTGEIKELKSQVKEATGNEVEAKEDKPVIPTDLVEYQGKKYRFVTAKFRLPGIGYDLTASEVITDKNLLKKIFEIPDQGLLTEVF